MGLKLLIVFTGIIASLFIYKSTDKELVWSDEFNNTDELDTTKWKYDLGNGCPELCGWGNNELQYYTSNPSNVRVENGHLIIEAHATDSTKYTSAKLISTNKGNWLYGRIEVRAKLPSGVGTWPAIWMLPAKKEHEGWPKSGEIDIMEHVGFDHGKIHGTVHTESFNHMKGTQKGKFIEVENVETEFHVYAIEWNTTSISFFVDDEMYNQFENTKQGYSEWPFDKPFKLILNIAVGGMWGGQKGVDDSIWPQRMEVDYVRIYEL